MSRQPAKVDKLFADWQKAEEQFSKALDKDYGEMPDKVSRDSALEMARLRSRADSAMDKFFKRALS